MTSLTETQQARKRVQRERNTYADSVKVGNVARTLVERMGVTWTAAERAEVYGFLFRKMWTDMSSERFQAIEAEVQA